MNLLLERRFFENIFKNIFLSHTSKRMKYMTFFLHLHVYLQKNVIINRTGFVSHLIGVPHFLRQYVGWFYKIVKYIFMLETRQILLLDSHSVTHVFYATR